MLVYAFNGNLLFEIHFFKIINEIQKQYETKKYVHNISRVRRSKRNIYSKYGWDPFHSDSFAVCFCKTEILYFSSIKCFFLLYNVPCYLFSFALLLHRKTSAQNKIIKFWVIVPWCVYLNTFPSIEQLNRNEWVLYNI